jgi:hypothetical protein
MPTARTINVPKTLATSMEAMIAAHSGRPQPCVPSARRPLALGLANFEQPAPGALRLLKVCALGAVLRACRTGPPQRRNGAKLQPNVFHRSRRRSCEAVLWSQRMMTLTH